MAANVVINVKALTGQATRELDKLKRSFGDLTTSAGWKSLVTGVGVGAGVAAFNAVAAAAAGAAAGVGQFTQDSIRAASDLAEAQNKVTVVFGQSSSTVERFAESAARSMGASRAEALAAAGTFGNLFTSMGLTQDAAAGMSTSILQLAGDLASFNNIGTDQALEKLRSGLVGEAEPLRSLGVQLTAAAVAAKAVELGLAASTSQVSEAAKVQARYALILEQTTNAQGDYGRTADGLANSQRTLDAQVQDLQASIGEALLPVMAELVRLLRDDLLPPLQALTSWFKENRELIGSLVNALIPFGTTLGWLRDKSKELTDQYYASARGADTFAESLGAARAPAVSTGTAIDDVSTRADALRARLADATASVRSFAAGVTSSTDTVRQALANLRTALQSETSTSARLAYLGGILYGKELARGIKSKDPDVRAAAINVRNAVLAEIDRLTAGAYSAGARAAAALAAGVEALLARAARMNETFTQEELDRLRRQAAAYRAIEQELRAAAGAGSGNPYASASAGASSASSSIADMNASARSAIATLSNMKTLVASLAATMKDGWTPKVLTLSQAQTALTSATAKFNDAMKNLRPGSAASLAAVTSSFAKMKQAALNFYAAQRNARVADLQNAIAAVNANVAAFRKQLDETRRARQQADLEEAARNARGIYTDQLDAEIANLEAAAAAKARAEEESRLKTAVTQAKTRADRENAQQALNAFYERTRLDELRAQRDRKDAIERADTALTDFMADQELARLQAAADAQVALYNQQIEAANRRYEAQVANLQKIAAAVESGLAKVKGIWTTHNAQTLGLLRSYTTQFRAAGKLLYDAFATGVRGTGTTVTPAPPVGSNPEARARGGPVRAGKTYLVGEKGPEYLTLGRLSGFVTPPEKLAGLGERMTLRREPAPDARPRGEKPVVLQLVVDGRKLAEIVDERLFMAYRSAAKGVPA